MWLDNAYDIYMLFYTLYADTIAKIAAERGESLSLLCFEIKDNSISIDHPAKFTNCHSKPLARF